MKEVVEALERIVEQEDIPHIIIVADDLVQSLLRDQMPKHLAERIVDHLKVEAHASLQDVVAASLEGMKRQNARTDREKVDAAIAGDRAGALGVVGAGATLEALVNGQVDELLISASVAALEPVSVPSVAAIANDNTLLEPAAARVTFIEDATLLEDHGGVAALLRFRI